jgi:hypothetical protein
MGLKSGDAAIEGSREYVDYRDQLISEDEAANTTAAYEFTSRRPEFQSMHNDLCPRGASGLCRSRSRQTARFPRTLPSALRMVSLF